jgi:membrane protease YdiL (CAAX protease family)
MSFDLRIVANLLPVAVLIGSTAVVYRLLQRLQAGHPLVEYQPRRRVPWNFLPPAVLLGLSFTSLAISPQDVPELESPEETAAVAVAASSGPPGFAPASAVALAGTAKGWSTLEAGGLTALDMWAQTLAFGTLAMMIGAVLVLGYRAGPSDLGLPTSWRQLWGDVRTGATAFLAVLLPVYAIQLTLTLLLEPSQGHPLIEELQVRHSVGMMIGAAAAAVAAAPLLEEITFRLVFQGWLERTEDRLLGLSEDAPWNADGVLPGLVRGWAPILVSGVAFSAAHWGHGVAPVSLLPLGWTLGYLYQRTHRLAPSVVCHALFNALSLIMVGLELMGGAE